MSTSKIVSIFERLLCLKWNSSRYPWSRSSLQCWWIPPSSPCCRTILSYDKYIKSTQCPKSPFLLHVAARITNSNNKHQLCLMSMHIRKDWVQTSAIHWLQNSRPERKKRRSPVCYLLAIKRLLSHFRTGISYSFKLRYAIIIEEKKTSIATGMAFSNDIWLSATQPVNQYING